MGRLGEEEANIEPYTVMVIDRGRGRERSKGVCAGSAAVFKHAVAQVFCCLPSRRERNKRYGTKHTENVLNVASLAFLCTLGVGVYTVCRLY